MEKEKPTISEKLKNRVSSFFGFGSVEPKTVDVQFSTARQALGKIFNLMVKIEEERKNQSEIESLRLQIENIKENKKNQELIKALTGRKKKVLRQAKVKKPVAKKEEVKELPPKPAAEAAPVTPPVTPKPSAPAVPTPAAPTPTPPVPKPPAPTPPTPKPPAPTPVAPPPAAPVAIQKPPIIPGTVVGGAAITVTGLMGKEALAANIAKYESKASSGRSFGGNEYNAYNKGTVGNRMIPADKKIDFSKMTITEYLRRGALKSGDPDKVFAVGRYQIIPETMKSLVQKLKIDPDNTYLDAPTQDMLFSKGLISFKRKKVEDYIMGKSDDRDAAILELAKEFASVGIPYDMKVGNKFLKKGESYYSGIGGNKAHNSPEEVGAALDIDRSKNLMKNTPPPIVPNVGQMVDEASSENKAIRRELSESPNNIINNINNAAQQTQTPQIDGKKVDEITPPIIKKARP